MLGLSRLKISLMTSAGVGGSFSPASLFASGEPGGWYDPSDLTTLFQDSAGTVPVTAAGQTVGLVLDKSKGLVLGPELVTNGDFSNGATGWSTTNTTIASGAATMAGVRVYKNLFRNISATGMMLVSYQVTSVSVAGTLRPRIGSVNGTARTISAPGTYTEYISNSGTQALVFETGGTNTFEGTIDNISVKELPGNHLSQPTLANRPIYGIEPFGGRRNLLTYTEQFDNAAWYKSNSSVTSTNNAAPDGSNTACLVALAASAEIQQNTTSSGSNNALSLYVKAAPSGSATHIRISTNDGVAWGTGVSQKIALTSSWQRIEIGGDLLPGSAGNLRVIIGTRDAIGNNDGQCVGNVLIWGAQLETGSTATAYQRVTTAFDVTQAGVADCYYLAFDGSDDWLQSAATIDPGAVDKVQVFAGVRKLSDAVGMIAEHSDGLNRPGSFRFFSDANYNSICRGTLDAGRRTSSSTTGANTSVISVQHDLAGVDSETTTIIRRNANLGSVGLTGTTAGGGNYLTYTHFIGRRGGTTAPFNGRLYGLITRFGANLSASTITQTENWVAGKTGITI